MSDQDAGNTAQRTASGGTDMGVEVIEPPNKLIEKVGMGGPGAIDLEALERAEKVIVDMRDEYLQWVGKDLSNLANAYDRLKDAGGTDRQAVERIYQIGHDIKGQGGSFGFPLMTTLGAQLCRLIESRRAVSDKELEVIALHVNAMSLVVGNQMRGDGGKDGQALVSGLGLLVDKFAGQGESPRREERA